MSCTITYPSMNGPGACSGPNLITACGTWDRPADSSTGAIRVFGKLYDPGATVDAKPPSDAIPASQILEVGLTRTWHFNSNPLPGAAIGSPKKLMIWITADDSLCYVPATNPTTFNCCATGTSGCTPAHCMGSFGTPPAPADATCGPT